jgi:hypothetical protein
LAVVARPKNQFLPTRYYRYDIMISVRPHALSRRKAVVWPTYSFLCQCPSKMCVSTTTAQRRQAATQCADCLSPPRNETRIVSISIMLVKVSGPSLSSYDRVVLKYGNVIVARSSRLSVRFVHGGDTPEKNVIFAGWTEPAFRWSLYYGLTHHRGGGRTAPTNHSR